MDDTAFGVASIKRDDLNVAAIVRGPISRSRA
jgi:hypothetical protein